MELNPTEMTPVINRIKRAQGQLAGVLRLLGGGRDCEDVVMPLAAVSKTLDRGCFGGKPPTPNPHYGIRTPSGRQLMKTHERVTLLAVATAYAGYLCHQAMRSPADDRWCRLAAGESAFERNHPRFHQKRAAREPKSPVVRALANA